MSGLFVKICGITRAGDAELAANLGARALGFVFWPGSPRYVRPEKARAIVARVGARVPTVGVFVDEDIDEVRRTMDFVGLTVAQLHGHESPEYCRELGDRTVIKAIAVTDEGTADVSAYDPEVLILLDAHDPALHGGTGRVADWESARRIAGSRRTILAGGLNADNVGAAVDTVRPYGIDVSSGVESAPGMKDPDKLKRFFEALHD